MGGLAVFKATPGRFTALLKSCSTASEMDAWGLVKATCFIAAMVDPGIVTSSGQVTVGNVLPVLSNLLYPIRATCIATGFLPASATFRVLGVVTFEELIGIALDTIEHSP